VADMNTYKSLFTELWNDSEYPVISLIESLEGVAGNELAASKIKTVEKMRDQLLLKTHEQPVIFIGMGTCGLANGAQKVHDTFVAILKEKNIIAQLISTGCVGYCAKEVIVDVKLPGKPRITYCEVKPEDVPVIVETTVEHGQLVTEKLLAVYEENGWQNVTRIDQIPFFRKQKKVVLENCGVIDPESIDQYLSKGGYRAVVKALTKMTPQDVVKEVLASGLRGRGGGGFPSAKKWELAALEKADTKYLVCNADEGDPGAFMDRAVLESDPHRVVEGMIIAAYAMGASEGYIYCRAEYPLAIKRLEKTIHDAKEYGLLGKNILGSGFSFNLKIKKGAGAFVCGEETALLN